MADNLELPIQAVTETFAILGRRGTGKTSTGVVLVEEMLKAGQHVCVLDPVGVWHGLRSSADGSAAGQPIIILGGQHADVPLPTGAGAEIAHLVTDERLSVVLDMSDFTQGEKARFVTAFAETLYRLKGRARQPLHMVVDEADFFVPQQPQPDEKRMLGAMDRIQRQGRVRGLGMTLISQRPAVVNKNALTQTEILITMQLTGPQDIKAIDDWISSQGTAEQRKELLASVTSLPVGTGWVCSPSFLSLFARVAFRPRETYDSSATPKVGEELRAPAARASIDILALRARLESAVQSVAEDDPAQLRARVADLQRDLAQARTMAPPEVRIETVEVPVLPPADIERLSSIADDFSGIAKDILALGQDIRNLLEANLSRLSQPRPPEKPRQAALGHRVPKPDPPAEKPFAASSRPSGPSTDKALPAPQQRIIDALAWWESVGVPAPTRHQIGFAAGYSGTSGTFGNYLGALRTAGLVDYPGAGCVALTEPGRRSAEPLDLPKTRAGLHGAVTARLPRPQARILQAICDVFPKMISREEIGKRVDMSYTSGTFGNYLGALRTLGLITYPSQGWARAADVLFPKGLA